MRRNAKYLLFLRTHRGKERGRKRESKSKNTNTRGEQRESSRQHTHEYTHANANANANANGHIGFANKEKGGNSDNRQATSDKLHSKMLPDTYTYTHTHTPTDSKQAAITSAYRIASHHTQHGHLIQIQPARRHYASKRIKASIRFASLPTNLPPKPTNQATPSGPACPIYQHTLPSIPLP